MVTCLVPSLFVPTSSYVYYNFAQLLKEAGITVGETMMNIFGKGRFVAFIPTNEAIQTALSEGKIPGATNASFDEDGKLTGEFDTATLKDYLNSYFITGAKNTIAAYPYPGSSFKSGTYKTESSVAPNLIYTDNGSTLNLELQGHGQVPSGFNLFQFPVCFWRRLFSLD